MSTAEVAAVRPKARDYAKNPMLVYWETTQACALACRHCRANAMPACHPDQLTRAEGRELLQQIAGFGEPLPHLVLTGGDPLEREDLFELIDRATALGLSVSVTPSVTPELTGDVIAMLRAHGVHSIGLSLDGSTAALHEAVRGVEGCFGWTMAALHAAAKIGMPVQVNTLLTEETADDLFCIYSLLTQFKIMRWSIFFLIATGRGASLREVSPERGEQLMKLVYDLAQTAPFAIKTTEAPSYRRIALNQMRSNGMMCDRVQKASIYQGFGIRDGNGIVFVSHQGDIYPAGFLPLAAGNVRRDRLADVYRSSPLFKALHDPDALKGRCGECEYRRICGGSRARAFAHTGDPLECDPLCTYSGKRQMAEDLRSFQAAPVHPLA
ncbi:MAG TPA: TIGR04053 family radical SAM/SPASM domain-containing protein [Terriglobales bacterium]|nr:TIGR04053 family radical SAM/SPASM domain-containing protein [Terriglobales bacterium]